MIDTPLTDESTLLECEEWLAELRADLPLAMSDFERDLITQAIKDAEEQRDYVASLQP